MPALVGNDGLLYVDPGDGTPVLVGFQRGLTHEQTRELIDASHKGSDHTENVLGRQSGTLTMEGLRPSPALGLEASHTALYNAQNQRQRVTLQIVERDGGDGSDNLTREAEALVSTITVEYPDNDVATFTVELALQEALATV